MSKPISAEQRAIHRRQVARRLAMQALYQWQMTQQSATEIERQFKEDADFSKADAAYFQQMLSEVIGGVDALDAALSPHLSRPIDAVDPVERALLRLAANELIHHAEIPYRVVINEAVALSKKFGAEQAYKMVNGVLDRLVPTYRSLERSTEST